MDFFSIGTLVNKTKFAVNKKAHYNIVSFVENIRVEPTTFSIFHRKALAVSLLANYINKKAHYK
jgi:hypothetical protein